jgi:hypothetical protein
MRDFARILAIALAGALACSDPEGDPDDFELRPGAPPPVATDADVYTLTRVDGGYTAEALATYTNTTGRTVYYRRCLPESTGPIFGLRRTGADSSAPALVGGVWACVGGVHTGLIRPGGTLSARVDLGSWDSPQAQPPVTTDQRVGRFRIEFALCAEDASDSSDCEALPQAARESNAFDLRLPSSEAP